MNISFKEERFYYKRALRSSPEGSIIELRLNLDSPLVLIRTSSHSCDFFINIRSFPVLKSSQLEF